MNFIRGMPLTRFNGFGFRCNGIRNKRCSLLCSYCGGPNRIDHKGVWCDTLVFRS